MLRGVVISFLTRLLVAIYLIESGLLLAVSPWMLTWWRRNYFAEHSDIIQSFMLSDLGWKIVMGVGLLTALGGVADLFSAFVWRAGVPSQTSPSPAPES